MQNDSIISCYLEADFCVPGLLRHKNIPITPEYFLLLLIYMSAWRGFRCIFPLIPEKDIPRGESKVCGRGGGAIWWDCDLLVFNWPRRSRGKMSFPFWSLANIPVLHYCCSYKRDWHSRSFSILAHSSCFLQIIYLPILFYSKISKQRAICLLLIPYCLILECFSLWFR